MNFNENNFTLLNLNSGKNSKIHAFLMPKFTNSLKIKVKIHAFLTEIM